MNYKETFYFIAKCLTISLDKKNRCEIERYLKNHTINWDDVVKVSTANYVFPALFCNLKRVNFLDYLPQDLINYMQYITNLNRERNLKIILQAKKLNSILLANKIRPIFLKGTANLLSELYEDIAERMVGDIDFIFSKEDYPKAITVLKDNGYYDIEDYFFPNEKHYRRIQNDNFIAAVEIHYEILAHNKYKKEFNYDFVEKDSQVINDIRVMSYANKLNLSIVADQIDDNGFIYKNMSLRNAYDVFILSKKTKAKDAVNNLDKLNHPLNCFLAACFEVFNHVTSLEFNINKKTIAYLNSFKKQFINLNATRRKHRFIQIHLFLKSRLYLIFMSIFYKEYRLWLFKRITDKNWSKKKVAQFNYNKFSSNFKAK